METAIERFKKVRAQTEQLVRPLKPEDYAAQPILDVSPPKWKLVHTTCFFETFLLEPHLQGYPLFDQRFSFLFYSYYYYKGQRVARDQRGAITRPTVEEVLAYRSHVNEHIERLLHHGRNEELSALLEIGINHEQQHQELLVYDMKYILGHQPFPEAYGPHFLTQEDPSPLHWLEYTEGVYGIGHHGDGFSYDNEHPRHKVYVPRFEIASRPVINEEWLAFMADGGYSKFSLWHDEAWQHIQAQGWQAPLYWQEQDGQWLSYDMDGLQPINPKKPVQHISFYEAFAFAEWAGYALPTEFQWELASGKFPYGQVWEWTYSAYHPYPGYAKAEGALGEYNGKFMINQMVLRGASVATAQGHSRATYRNFFPAAARWMFSGLRLVKNSG